MNSLVTAASRLLSQAALAISCLGLLTLVALLGWQVFARYVLGSSPAWSEQAALVVMIGFIALAAAAGVREGFHIGMTMAVDALPARAQQIAQIGANLVIAAFGGLLGVQGGALAQEMWSHTIPSLGLPRGAAYIPLAISGWLMLFFAAEQVLAIAQGRKVEPLWN